MSLKDSSAYNIQFRRQRCRPVLIDTLSFESYQEGKPWDAYRQYCQHFLAPLALMAYTDIRLSQLLRVYIDGVPLDLASKLLPRKTRRNFGLLSHIHLHAAAQERYSGKTVDKDAGSRQMNKTQFLGLIDSLERTTDKLTWQGGGTEWGEYYKDTNYSDQAMQAKQALVGEFLDHIQPKTVWDLGGNTGLFSRIASQRGILTLSFDIDPTAVEINYLDVKKNKEDHLIPLVLDLTNPSPSIGWDNRERLPIGERGSAGAVLALALIHHLAISNNVPLPQAAAYFASLGKWLVVEFVPKSDLQVKRLLATRKDIFPSYTPEGFEAAFSQVYKIVRKEPIEGSERTLYLMEKR
jgi:hypothetical protein